MKGNGFYSILICMIFFLHADQSFSQRRPEDAYAYQVFDKLVKTINQNSIPKPRLNIIPDPTTVAETYPNGEIKVGTLLIERCRSFGKDSSTALAHIFSHELTHYYQNHFWAENFGTSYANSNWGKLIENSASSLMMVKTYETQADQYGMYYSLSAGYNTFEIGERVLDSVYTWFQLNDQLRGYPSRTERKQIAELSKHQITDLIPAFEAGNILLSLAQVYTGAEQACLAEMSTYFFEDIVDRKIKTKELLNNMAIGKTIAALQYFTGDYKVIRFPFMLESKSMLYDVSSSRSSNESGINGYVEAYEEQVSGLLNEAEMNLLEALKFDKTFYPAYINLSIVYCMKQKYGAAQDELVYALKYMGEDHPLVWAIYELQGIIGHLQLQNDLSEKLFAAANAKGSLTAGYNALALKNDYKPGTVGSLVYYSTDTTEKIASTGLFDFLNKLSVNRQGRYDLKNSQAVLFMDTLQGYIAFNIKPQPEATITKLRFIITKPGAEVATSKGLQCGDTAGRLTELYGDEEFVLLESDQSILVYPQQNLMVWVMNDKVEKWCYWWVK